MMRLGQESMSFSFCMKALRRLTTTISIAKLSRVFCEAETVRCLSFSIDDRRLKRLANKLPVMRTQEDKDHISEEQLNKRRTTVSI